MFIGDHSDRLAPGWQHGREGVVRSQRDPPISQRATLRCCGRSWHRLLLECTWTILRKQGQLQAHTLRLTIFLVFFILNMASVSKNEVSVCAMNPCETIGHFFCFCLSIMLLIIPNNLRHTAPALRTEAPQPPVRVFCLQCAANQKKVGLKERRKGVETTCFRNMKN